MTIVRVLGIVAVQRSKEISHQRKGNVWTVSHQPSGDPAFEHKAIQGKRSSCCFASGRNCTAWASEGSEKYCCLRG